MDSNQTPGMGLDTTDSLVRESLQAVEADEAVTETFDVTGAMEAIRRVLRVIADIGPFDGTASNSGTNLVVRQFDGSVEMWFFQHVAGGTLRAVRMVSEDGGREAESIRTPLETNESVRSYLRALMVEVLR